MKQVLLTILIAALSASLTANYFLYNQTPHIEPIELKELK